MMRCLALVGQKGLKGNSGKTTITNKAFYVSSTQKCACSSGACTPTQPNSGYTSYKIVATPVEKPGYRTYLL